jgi:hypothetical protein
MQYVILILIGYILIKQNPALLSDLSSAVSGIGGTLKNSVTNDLGGPFVPSKPRLTKEQAWQMATATEANLNPRDFTSPTYINGAYGGILDYTLYIEPGQCQQQGQHLPLYNIVSKEALAGASIASKISHATAFAGPIGLAIASAATVVTQIIGAIINHHAQAVARDNAAFCTYVPAMNNALKVFIEGVQNGQLSHEQGIAGLMQLPDTFLQGVGPAKNNSPYCNALCEQLVQLRAICFYWRSQLGDTSL